jgi:hypothetical protein
MTIHGSPDLSDAAHGTLSGGAHDGVTFFSRRRAAMIPTSPLKLSAIVFAATWTGWMLWRSGSLEPVNIIMLAIGGVAVGYGWYRAMCWQFQRRGMLPRNDQPADPAAKQ